MESALKLVSSIKPKNTCNIVQLVESDVVADLFSFISTGDPTSKSVIFQRLLTDEIVQQKRLFKGWNKFNTIRGGGLPFIHSFCIKPLTRKEE